MGIRQRLSLEEYLALPEQKPALEYIDGEVVQKPVARRKHWKLAALVAHILLEYQREHGGAAGVEAHVFFEDVRQYRVPDAVYWAPAKPQGDDRVSLPPTLAVEIRSPEQTLEDMQAKARFYITHGVDACLLIDPEDKFVEAHEPGRHERLSANGRATFGPMPGFALSVAELWASLDR